MAKRRIGLFVQDEAGNVVGGTGYSVKAYLAGTRTAATLYLGTSGNSRPNPGTPNSGQQTTLTATGNSGDTSITVASTAGFTVGDMVPINGGGGRTLVVIRTITNATSLLLDASINTYLADGFNYPVGSTVGGPEQIGHFQAFVEDTQDYDITVKNNATGVEGDPQAWATLQTTNLLNIQEEGTTVSTRGTLNFKGANVLVTDNGGSSRADVDFDKRNAQGSVTGATTIDWANGTNVEITLTGAITLTLSNPAAGGWYAIKALQDATGSRAITWPGTVKWTDAVTPTSSGANKTDLYSLYYDGTNYFGSVLQNY